MEKERKREEGEGRGREERREKRGRIGGEMRKKGIVIGGIVLSLLMSCNNGLAELEKKNQFLDSIANLGKGFLDVFVSFGDMVSDAFSIKSDTKKEDIGKYFTKIAETMGSVKEKLNNEVAKNGNYEKVKKVVDQFIKETLDVIAEGAKEAAKGATSGDAIGNAVHNQDAVAADIASVNALVKGIKEIVGVVLKKGEGDAGATKTGDTEQQSIGKLFGEKTNDGIEAQAAAASASIGAVTGADILKAISESEDAKGQPTIAAAKNAAEIATAQQQSQQNLSTSAAKKDAVIAAGIALRAMAKGGKFVAKNTENKSAHAINGAAASAVNKTLSTLIIAIRNTVDSGLKTINDSLAAVNQGDMSAETGEAGATKK